jgi:deoxyribodipyrimidine photo-lyase
MATLVWFQADLRIADNPALHAAARRGSPIIPVYIWAPEEEGGWAPGGASRWWLHHSLLSLEADLRNRGSRLVIRRGRSLEVLRTLAQESRASAVFWNRRYEPAAVGREREIAGRLRADGLTVESFNAALLFEPSHVQTRQGRPFQVFTPFWRACLAQPEPALPVRAPRELSAPRRWPQSLRVDNLALEPRHEWTAGLRAAWRPGAAGAANRLRRFLREALASYGEGRDRPDRAGTSRLSPHLHFGEISPRQIWHAVQRRVRRSRRGATQGAQAFLRELGWREFAHHLLFHFPHTPDRPLRREFARFPWRKDRTALKAWQRGQTGYPLVDAGMRELWATGWMHNRVRMIVASFLVKHLLLPWRAGARWFWDTLVDADLANNTLGWQWVAGCGADAAPFFRIFNPVTQGEKFDPQGDYVRRWVPELARLRARWIHKPWAAPPHVLREAGVMLGRTYPEPIVDHAAARHRALAAWGKIRKRRERER